jgi:hypothetical protein
MREDFNEHVSYWKSQFAEMKEAYKTLFCELYGFDVNDAYWTGNVLEVADYFFGLYDIMYAVNTPVPEELLFRWYDYSLTLVEYSLGDSKLENFVRGHRPYSEESITKLRELQSEFTKSKIALDDFLNELRNGN